MMKKSELYQIIREEIQALNESRSINIEIWYDNAKEKKFIKDNVAKFGGKIGWVEEKKLSKKII